MKLALSTIYMRMGNVHHEVLRPPLESAISVDQEQTMKLLTQNLALLFFAKYLLISTYLASHKKNHGKQRKRLQSVNAKVKVSEKMATQLRRKLYFNFCYRTTSCGFSYFPMIPTAYAQNPWTAIFCFVRAILSSADFNRGRRCSEIILGKIKFLCGKTLLALSSN